MTKLWQRFVRFWDWAIASPWRWVSLLLLISSIYTWTIFMEGKMPDDPWLWVFVPLFAFLLLIFGWLFVSSIVFILWSLDITSRDRFSSKYSNLGELVPIGAFFCLLLIILKGTEGVLLCFPPKSGAGVFPAIGITAYIAYIFATRDRARRELEKFEKEEWDKREQGTGETDS